MTIRKEVRLCNLETWGGAFDRFKQLTCDELDELETILEDLYPDGIDETMLNDLFWFQFTDVCEWLGLEVDEETDEIIRH